MKRAILFLSLFLLVVMAMGVAAKDVNPAVKEAQQEAQDATKQREAIVGESTSSSSGTEQEATKPQDQGSDETTGTKIEKEKKPSLLNRYLDSHFVNTWYGATLTIVVFLGLLVLVIWLIMKGIRAIFHRKDNEDGYTFPIILLVFSVFSLMVAFSPLVFAKGDKMSGEELTAISLAHTQSLKDKAASIDKLNADISKILIWMGDKPGVNGGRSESYDSAADVESESHDYTNQQVGPLKSKLPEIEKKLKAIQDDQATLTVERKFNEKMLLLAVGKTDAEISAFFLLDPIKDIEKRQAILSKAWTKLAEKPVIDWNGLQAQAAIDARADARFYANVSKLLSDLGIKPGKIKVAVGDILPDGSKASANGERSETLAEMISRGLDENYARKVELTKTQTKVSELSTAVINNALDIAQLQECIVWVNATDAQGKPCRVPKAIQWDMMPEQVKDAIAKMPTDKNGIVLQAASQTDLEKKANKADLNNKADKTELESVKKDVKLARDATTELTFGNKDRTIIRLYAAYYRAGDIEGFKSHLKNKFGDKWQKKFDEIKSEAEALGKAGKILLEEPTTQQKKIQ